MTITIFKYILLALLVLTAIAIFFIKNPLVSVVVFMSYSSIMAVIWILIEAPDLAITEAAVGAGITSVLFFITLKKIHQIDASQNNPDDRHNEGDDDDED